MKDSAPMYLVDSGNSTFTSSELNRLAIYRAAVQAGFYTDALDGATPVSPRQPASAAPGIVESTEAAATSDDAGR